MNSDLNHIIEQCKSENRASQKELYFLTIAKFKVVLRRYCKETNDAQDIIQSTYLRIFECIHQFDAQKGDFYHWANRILINEFFKLMRSRKKVIMLPDESIDEEYSLQFNWNKFTLEEVQQVIKSMNETQSILLHLYYIELIWEGWHPIRLFVELQNRHSLHLPEQDKQIWKYQNYYKFRLQPLSFRLNDGHP